MSLTYFIQMDGPEALVKIGRTNSPQNRLKALRTGLPWSLRLVAVFGRDLERELQKRFVGDRVAGEWFRPSQAMADYLRESCDDGHLVRQVPVDQAYINAAIKPRIKEYLNGRDPQNNGYGDLVRCILADLLPTLESREAELERATKGAVPVRLSKGFGPTNEQPVLHLPATSESGFETVAQAAA